MQRRGHAFWARTIAKFEQSEMTQPEFCRREGLAFGTFQNWRRRIRKEQTSLVRVEFTATSRVEAELPSGIRLRFADAEPGFIAAVLKAC